MGCKHLPDDLSSKIGRSNIALAQDRHSAVRASVLCICIPRVSTTITSHPVLTSERSYIGRDLGAKNCVF